MELFGPLAVASYWLVSLAVSLKLLQLASRTGGLPELMVGLSLLAGGTLGYPCTVAATLLATSAPEWAVWLGTAGILALTVGGVAILLAWRQIYHPRRAWSRRVVCVLAAVVFVTTVDYVVALRPGVLGSNVDPEGTWSAASWRLGQAVLYALQAISGLHYCALLRRRIPLGLADPVVANRIWLWSMVACAVVVQYAYVILVPVLNSWFPAGALTTAFVGSLGILNAAALLLAFSPPRRYVDWIAARAGHPA